MKTLNHIIVYLLFSCISFAQIPGNALKLINNNSYSFVPNSAVLNITGSYTIEAWVKVTDNPEGGMRIIDKSTPGGPDEYLLDTYPAGIPRIVHNGLWLNATDTLKINKWTHLAAVFNASNMEAKIYINGELKGTGTATGLPSSNSNDLTFGRTPVSFPQAFWFDGMMDEIRIWNYDRSQSQIQSTMFDTLSAVYYSNSDSGLIGYWRFDELSDLGIGSDGADDIKDFSVYQNHADLQGEASLTASITAGDNLVAYFPFNGNVIDQTGNGHNGTVNGGILTSDRFNQQGRAYTFPNLHDNIVLDNSTSLNFENGFTLNAWIKYKNINCGIVGKHNCWVINGYYLGIENGNFIFRVGNSVWSEIRTNDTFTEDKWYMITAVFNKELGLGEVFVNGELKTAESAEYTNFSTASITISEASNNCPDGNMPGAIDEVKIFDRALSDEEVLKEYNLTRTDMVLFLPFDGNADDESGKENNGTVNGAGLIQDRFGIQNSAYSFNGFDNFITIEDNSLLFSDSLTISWWYNVDEYRSGENVVIGWVDGGHRYQQFFTGNQLSYLNGYNVNQPAILFNPTYNLSELNVWKNVVVTYKKTSESTSTSAIYVDGELKQSDNHNLAMDYVPGINFFIGKNHTGNYFKGSLDDFRIYNRVLNDQEIIALFNDSSTYHPPVNDTMVAYYAFNGNANDGSGNQNNGINYNGVFTKDRYGNDESSIYFNGIDSYVEGSNPGNNLPAGNSPRTFSAWIKENSFHPWGNNIFHYGLDQAAPTNFHFYTTNNIRIGNGYDYGVVFGNTTIVDSTWHFVTGVYNGGTEHTASVYVDGKLDGTGVISSEPNTILGSNWKIGRFITGSNNFDGNIDELKIYNLALTGQQIWEMYKATTTAPNLIYPQDDSTLINPTMIGLVLDWDSTVTASSYRLLIANDSLFSTVVHDTIVSTSSFDFYDWFSVNIDNLYWKVRTINDGGIGPWSETYWFNIILTDVKDETQLPTEFALMQNYPNPFNPSTTINYHLPKTANVLLKVYDVLGNEIATLVNEEKPAGVYNVEFGSKNSVLSSGIYFYKLTAGDYVSTRKMILIK